MRVNVHVKQRTDLWLPRGRGLGRVVWELGVGRGNLPYGEDGQTRSFSIAQTIFTIL